MTFTAMAQWQAWLLVASIATAVVVLYRLRRRYRRILVSSSVLWDRIFEERSSQSQIEKLRWVVSLLIALLIALLLAFSVGRLQIEWLDRGSPRVAILLDSSPTMLTRTSDGRTRWEHAMERAQEILDLGAVREILVADTSGSVGAQWTTNKNEALRTIVRMSPRPSKVRFPEIDGENTDIYVISDGVRLPKIPETAIAVSVFEAADNIGITAFEIRSNVLDPLRYEAYLEVANYSSSAKEIDIVIRGTGRDRLERSVRLDAGERLEDEFDMSGFGGGGVRVTVQALGDALAVDNIAYGYIPCRKAIRVVLVTKRNAYLEQLLAVDPWVELTIVQPSEFQEDSTADVYIFDQSAPESRPTKPSLLFAGSSAWLPQQTGSLEAPEITQVTDNHPIMRFVPMYDVRINRASYLEPAEAEVVVAAGEAPLILAGEKPERWVLTAFSLDNSDFPHSVGFPIFVRNVLTWLSGRQLAIRAVPGKIEVALAEAEITSIDGRDIPSRQLLGKTVFHAFEPGLFTARRGTTRQHVAVSFSDAVISNVNRSVFTTGVEVKEMSKQMRRELWFYMLAFAVVLIAMEWWTYHRRITV